MLIVGRRWYIHGSETERARNRSLCPPTWCTTVPCSRGRFGAQERSPAHLSCTAADCNGRGTHQWPSGGLGTIGTAQRGLDEWHVGMPGPTNQNTVQKRWWSLAPGGLAAAPGYTPAVPGASGGPPRDIAPPAARHLSVPHSPGAELIKIQPEPVADKALDRLRQCSSAGMA